MALLQLLKNNYRKSRQNRWNDLYDQHNNERVGKGLQVLANQGRTLSSSDEKKAEEYARSVLGSVNFAPWLKLYTAYRGEFLEGWIPDNYLGRVVCPAVNGEFRRLCVFKTLSRRILQSDALPDLVYFIKGNWISVTGEQMNLDQVKSYLFDRNESIYLKSDHSQQGLAVFKLDSKKFSEFNFNSVGDFVIQAPIIQHPFFDEFSPGGVATIRITTVKPIGQLAKNRLTTVRVGRKGQNVVQSQSSIRIPVGEDGSFFEEGTGSDWTVFDSHPDTGAKFFGMAIPNFAEAVQLCEALHDRFAHFQLIGWDVCVEESGEVKIMEWNTDEPGIIFSEAANGPHFQDLGWENLWK